MSESAATTLGKYASTSLVYLRIMRNERAAVYETIVGLLRKAINDDA